MMDFRDLLKVGLGRLAKWLENPVTPGELYLINLGEIQGENGMADRSKIKCLLPAVVEVEGEDKVVSRKLTVSTDGETDQVFTLSPADFEVTSETGYPQDQPVTFSLADTDDDGKESKPQTRTVTFTDETVPQQPGELNFENLGEIQG